jgi:hypothetical protein
MIVPAAAEVSGVQQHGVDHQWLLMVVARHLEPYPIPSPQNVSPFDRLAPTLCFLVHHRLTLPHFSPGPQYQVAVLLDTAVPTNSLRSNRKERAIVRITQTLVLGYRLQGRSAFCRINKKEPVLPICYHRGSHFPLMIAEASAGEGAAWSNLSASDSRYPWMTLPTCHNAILTEFSPR